MAVTIDIKILFIVLLLIALIVLVVYAIFVMRKLLVTLDHTNTVLEDVEKVSAVAANLSQDFDGIVDNVSRSVNDLTDATMNTSFISTVGSVAKSAASLKGILSGSDIEERAAKVSEKKSGKRSAK